MASRKVSAPHGTRAVSRLFATAFGVLLGCGPSLKSVHEGTVRFEHCNRLDLDEQATKADCGKCWKTWLGEYTYGQPHDRIDYARRRARALSNGDESRPALKFDESSAEARQFYLVVPGPTSVRTPPPPVATVWKDSDADAGALAKTNADGPPAESCADECRSTWQTCSAGCSNGNGHGAGATNGTNHVGPAAPSSSAAAGKPNGAAKGTGSKGSTAAAVCQKCRSDYSGCMRRCFE
jgi:hypothetical protein